MKTLPTIEIRFFGARISATGTVGILVAAILGLAILLVARF